MKPLVRLTEREMAAWCVVRGIDYLVEECPMAKGNRHLGYKETLNSIEADSPGAKAAFYLGFLDRMAPLLVGHSAAAVERAQRVRAVWLADHRRRLRVLPVARQVAGDRSGAGRARAVGARRAGSAMTGNFAAGEKVLLLDSKKRRYLIDLVDDGEFHSHAGFVTHASIIGSAEGVVVRSTKGSEYTGLAPDARGLRRRDAARRAGDLPEGPRPDLHAGRHRSRACGCSRAGSVRVRCR